MGDLFKKHKKYIKLGAIFFFVIMSIIYLRLFFQEGIIFDRTFLVKKESSQEKTFEGENRWGSIKIDVKGDYSKDNKVYINYKLPNEINRAYRADFNLDQTNDLYKVDILNEKDEEVFNGFYNKYAEYYLFDKDNELIFPDIEVYSPEDKEQDPYNSSYKITSYNVVGFASEHNLERRGDFKILFMAILLLVITIIDIKNPLFFFSLDTFLYVKDAEPSNFYLTMQKIGWFAFPILAIILLILAIS